jgi:hypothetical protein
MKKIFALLMLAMVLLAGCGEAKNGDYAEFAQCLTKKGIKLYTAWWCHNCENQKKLFGNDIKYIENIECSEGGYEMPDPEACKKAGITAYPSWVFPGLGEEPGTPLILSGTRSLEELAEKSKCPLKPSTEEQ